MIRLHYPAKDINKLNLDRLRFFGEDEKTFRKHAAISKVANFKSAWNDIKSCFDHCEHPVVYMCCRYNLIEAQAFAKYPNTESLVWIDALGYFLAEKIDENGHAVPVGYYIGTKKDGKHPTGDVTAVYLKPKEEELVDIKKLGYIFQETYPNFVKGDDGNLNFV
jgi:hypothetical protein